MRGRWIYGMLAMSLLGCARPWVKYEKAISCHLYNKGTECDPLYEKAIKADPKMRGVHASYGIHLLTQGNVTEANSQFAVERELYPDESGPCIDLALGQIQKNVRNDSASGSSAHGIQGELLK